MKSLNTVLISVCAALYAGFGYLTYLGLFTPVIGVVRFWPVVVIPAVFAILFNPLVGGLGAAIGIFISDLIIHGNILLSLTVGVPANFICFYLIGLLSKRSFTWYKTVVASIILFLLPTLITLSLYNFNLISFDITLIFTSVTIISCLILLIFSRLKTEWRSYNVACFSGLIIGSLIIGFGVWGFSQAFVLPQSVGGGYKMPIYASLIWFIWTFLTEIPFLLILGPPILSVVYKVFPSFKKWREAK
ncbi:MAG: hypothetical protein QW476_02265 [Candidatus Bathyarchaeia archaeon]|nr:hypothetical protein [Candidatus Bathyarchaeota archaeon]